MAKASSFDTTRHKAQLRTYFDGIGFERWSAIYGEGKLSGVRRSVREGHNLMLSHVEQWLAELTLPPTTPVLDAGCGTGLFTVAAAQQNLRVTAIDIAPQMVQATMQRARTANVEEHIHFVIGDLEVVRGTYAAVVCLDVLIHYPRPAFEQLCKHLASLSQHSLIITYAPHNPLLALMHRIGGYFPRSQRRTDIQMIPERVVHKTLKQAGMHVHRSTRVSRGFYHIALVEARR